MAEFIRVTYVVTYESAVDLKSYHGMTPEEAVAHENDSDDSTIIELISMADEDELTVTRDVQHVSE